VPVARAAHRPHAFRVVSLDGGLAELAVFGGEVGGGFPDEVGDVAVGGQACLRCLSFGGLQVRIAVHGALQDPWRWPDLRFGGLEDGVLVGACPGGEGGAEVFVVWVGRGTRLHEHGGRTLLHERGRHQRLPSPAC
jgi:hypothetical protein